MTSTWTAGWPAAAENEADVKRTARTYAPGARRLGGLLAVEDQRPDPTQESNDFAVYAQAREAQEVLTTKIAQQ